MKRTNDFSGSISRFSIVLSLPLIVFYFAGCKGQSGLMNFSPSQPAPQPAAAVPNTGALQNSYADLVSRVSPAVVTIRSTERSRAAQQFPFLNDPNFREFFGDRAPQETPR